MIFNMEKEYTFLILLILNLCFLNSIMVELVKN